jgi:DNA-directed RNA polymerase subunit RPC12/RpoP
MAKERKIKCDCGEFLEQKETKLDHIETEAMVCPKCGFTTLTKEQAEKFVRLKQLHQIMDAKRKIIKIGNSMGLTLPDKLEDFGAKVGKEVKIKALSPKSFKVELVG